MMTIDVTGALAREHIADLCETATQHNLAHEARRNARAHRPVAARSSQLSRLVAVVRRTADCCPVPCEAC